MADPTIRIKRSSIGGKIPTPDQVPLGEIALNTFDGTLYASKNVGIGTTVIDINPFKVGTGTDSYNTYFTAGNVGIGSTIPQYKLDITGDVNFTGSLYQNGVAFSSGGGGGGSYWVSTSAGIHTFSSVGIGTTNPQSSFHTVVTTGRALFETNSPNLNSILNLWNNNSSLTAGTGMLFSAGEGVSGITSFIGGVGAGLVGNTNNSLLGFRVLSNGSLTAADTTSPFYIQGNNSGATVVSNVNTGIGTTNPLQKLHVLGDLLVAAGTSTGQHITQKAYELNSGTLAWEGSAGQLFSITNNLTSGSIFSVNDVSGIPSIDVDANGKVGIATYNGTVSIGAYEISVITTNTSASKGVKYVYTSSATITLPASPAVGDVVSIVNRSGTTTATIGRNGSNIMGLAENMTVDLANASFDLVYVNSTQGWVVV